MKNITIERVEKQVLLWNKLAVFVPVFFLGTSLVLYWFNIMEYDHFFIVALITWSAIAVTWWFWTMFSIVFLARLLNRTVFQLTEISKEVKEIRKEII